MTIVISREYHFSSAHILVGHDKCGRMHGHNYRLVVYVAALHLHDGMVMDYHDLDTYVDPIVEQLDHRFIITEAEELEVLDWMAADPKMLAYLPIERSTAELLARWIGDRLIEKLIDFPYTEVVERIELWENHKSCAIWTPPTT